MKACLDAWQRRCTKSPPQAVPEFGKKLRGHIHQENFLFARKDLPPPQCRSHSPTQGMLHSAALNCTTTPHKSYAESLAWCGKFALKCKSGIQKLVVLLVVEMDVVLEVLAVLEEVEVVVKVKEVELLLEEKVEVDVVLEVLDVEIVEEALVVLVEELPDALSRLSS